MDYLYIYNIIYWIGVSKLFLDEGGKKEGRKGDGAVSWKYQYNITICFKLQNW